MLHTDEKHRVLSEYFGHKEFRSGQEEIIDSLLSGKDALCIMPTGAGKSMCYQIPAMILSGITIVISPLISLMTDQVNSLIQSGISAAYINSLLTPAQMTRTFGRMEQGQYKIVYVAPERLSLPEFVQLCSRIDISMVAVDEAHCVSQWGQDFRPSYLTIADFIAALPKRPIVGAFTATATKTVRNDIAKYLMLDNPFMITTGFDRQNLYFSVLRPTTKRLELMRLIADRQNQSGIIYCISRKNVESICDFLNAEGYSATRYHAGLTETERKENQDDFVYDRKTIMVATNAFGMGIDKSNVSYVIHYNMPKDIESYYQEAGRAGRDGAKAECILLYSGQDVRTNTFLIEKSDENSTLSDEERELVRRKDLERLKLMTFYSTTDDCLRGYILKYFGEHFKGRCGNCSNCTGEFTTIDITIDAQKILSCIVRTNQRFGRTMITNTLRGSREERIISLGLDKQTTYGLMKDYSNLRVNDTIDALINQKYIEEIKGDYPFIRLTPTAIPVLKGTQKVSMRVLKDTVSPTDKVRTANRRANRNEPIDENLFGYLKKLRRELAFKASVPTYVIFTDATLTEMCNTRPKSRAELASVSGVGKMKLEKYGDLFIKAINDFDKLQNI